MKRSDLTEENVREVLEDIIGYDPDEAAAWPSLPGIVAPTRELVSEVVEELGWSPRNRHARICVGSILQLMMMRATKSARSA